MLPTDVNYVLMKNLIQTPEKTLSFVSGTTVYSFLLYGNALTHTIVLVMPTITGAVCTATLKIENKEGREIYTSATTLAEATTHILATEKPIVGRNKVTVTLSTDPLSSATAYVSLYLQGRN